MRHFAAILLTCCALAAHAQNWALLNPAYRYNYSNDGTDTISNQIRVMQVDTLGPDSLVLRLNDLVGPCGIGDGPNNYHIDLSVPQFLMRNCLTYDDHWVFSDSLHFIVESTAEAGASWTFRLEDSTQAVVSLVDTATVLGELDSVRTLVSMLGDTVTWSKAHGIVRWKLAGDPAYDLIGVQGPDLGILIPSLAEFYPYQAGDVVRYHSGYWYNMHSAETIEQYHITSRIDHIDSIRFMATRLRAHRPYSSGAWYYSSDSTGFVVTLDGYLMNAALSYPGAFVRYGMFPSECLIAKHGLNLNGFYQIENSTGYLYPDLTLIELNNDSNISCASVSPVATASSYWRMDTEVGFRGYWKDQLLTGYYFIWEGAVINGIPYGTLGDDEFFHVGMEAAPSTSSLAIAPNPATDFISLEGLSLGESLTILDMTGRAMLTTTAISTHHVMDLSELPPGCYLLRHGASKLMQRFIIAR
ncbi:MAG: T9SS type A sorting domain-containing protein [Flavobacteriales bacterium]|nr:T9SS type A sorting domain-containing protein [Flavobacteriales bacterium]